MYKIAVKEGACMLKGNPSLEEINEYLEEISKLEEEQKRAYLNFVERTKSLQPLAKAQAWLEYNAENPEFYSDQEALVYLRSHGRNCDKQIKDLITGWRSAANEMIRKSQKWDAIRNLDFIDTNTFALPNFWGGSHAQELSIDATMLRTVERCEISGFDQWWKRLAKDNKQDIVRGGVDPVPSSYRLFNHCRSKLSLELMKDTLLICLEAIEISSDGGRYPWNHFIRLKDEGKFIDHIPYASAVVFCNYILRGDTKDLLVQQALETIVRCQHQRGGWPCWIEDNLSIESTAMAVHAIVLGKPRGYERMLNDAVEWLWSQQHDHGCWNEPGAPDPVYLTVLVLDAIEIANGGNKVTFPLRFSRTNKPSSYLRFRIALSFPGDFRDYVEVVADKLVEKFSKAEVFYDNNFKAELATINLDTYLQNIYHNQSELIVIFLCAEYEKKDWCGLEWRAIRDLIKSRLDNKIMLFRFDDAKISGIYSIDGYIDISNLEPSKTADYICQRYDVIQNRLCSS